MQTDFKISWQKETASGIEMLVRFYEGETKMQKEMDSLTRKQKNVTRYRRSSVVREQIYTFPKGTDVVKELKKELKKDKSRIPIPELV